MAFDQIAEAATDRPVADLTAADLVVREDIGESDSCFSEASVSALRGIDAAQPDRLAGQIERVAVDDVIGLTGDLCRSGADDGKHHRGAE